MPYPVNRDILGKLFCCIYAREYCVAVEIIDYHLLLCGVVTLREALVGEPTGHDVKIRKTRDSSYRLSSPTYIPVRRLTCPQTDTAKT